MNENGFHTQIKSLEIIACFGCGNLFAVGVRGTGMQWHVNGVPVCSGRCAAHMIAKGDGHGKS